MTALLDEVSGMMGDLSKASTFEETRDTMLEKLSSASLALEVPSDVRSDPAVQSAYRAAAEAIRMLESLLQSAAGPVPNQDLTFRDLASDAKSKLVAFDSAVAASRAMTEGGRRRRRGKKTRKTRKGKKARMTRRR